MNSREMLDHVGHWLGWQDETFAYGLRNAFDALRLYDYAQQHAELPEMADDWEAADLIRAVGYNPFEESHDVEHTGAAIAADALLSARNILDSVAFISVEGDTTEVIVKIDRVAS